MRTYQARLHADAQTTVALNGYGERFGHALRTLHARRRAKVVVKKAAFMAEFDLTARQYNAVRTTLDGIEQSYRQRLPELLGEDRARLASVRKRLNKTGDRFKSHQLARRAARIKARIAARERDLAQDTVRICFGSRKLFAAQQALAANGYEHHAAWLRAWKRARSAQFFVLGSKDETAGCQGCVMRHLGDGRFALRLRLPNSAPERYACFEVQFQYGWEHLAWALDARQAISYRFLRDEKGWRVFATTAAVPIALAWNDLARGALGVDLNADHVALSLTKHDGNLASFQRLPLVMYGQSRDRAAALTGEAVKRIVAAALRARVPIVVERLDFAKKKARLREGGARYARMLSSFAYRRFVQILCARAHDASIAVVFVNPAYSSLIGRRKFARRYGMSGHAAAALVLARRAQKFSERPNRRDQVALCSPARKNTRHVWSIWAGIARKETRGALYGRSRLRDPSTAVAVGAITPLVAGAIPARESAAKAVRAASLAS